VTKLSEEEEMLKLLLFKTRVEERRVLGESLSSESRA
jgi:hypothetical protein